MIATYEKLKIPPNTTSTIPYTVPVIIDQSQSPVKRISKSYDIAWYLDATHSARSLFRGSQKSFAAQDEFLRMYRDMYPIRLWPLIAPRLFGQLNKPSAVFYRRTREERLERTLESLLLASYIESRWRSVIKGLDIFAKYLDKAKAEACNVLYADEGDILEPTYADPALCGGFVWLERAGPAGARVGQGGHHEWRQVVYSLEGVRAVHT